MSFTLTFTLKKAQSYFCVPKEVRLNSTHYLIMKIHNKTELQQTAINHSADFMKICKEGTGEPYYILTAVEVNIHYWHIKIHFDISGGWMGGFKNFCQNDMLHSNVNMDVSPNIWRRNTF